MDWKGISERISRDFTAKKRPEDVFSAYLFDVKEKAKELKNKWADQAMKKAEADLGKDLAGKGLKVLSLELKMGKFKGHPYISSSKLSIKMNNKSDAGKLLGYLVKKYSPKFKLKKFSDEGIAEFNIR